MNRLGALWLMLRHPFKVARFLSLSSKAASGVSLTWPALDELAALRITYLDVRRTSSESKRP